MSHGVGVLLLAAVAGYWVLERAERQRGALKRVGRLVGSIVIVVSVLGVACHVWSLATGASGWYPFGTSSKGLYCPYHGKLSPLPPSP